jgi:hypothetical protein
VAGALLPNKSADCKSRRQRILPSALRETHNPLKNRLQSLSTCRERRKAVGQVSGFDANGTP